MPSGPRIERFALLTVVALAPVTPLRGQGPSPLTDPIMRADLLYLADQAEASYDLLVTHLDGRPDDYGALWRAARAGVVAGLGRTDNREQNTFLDPALDFARRAVDRSPDGIDGRYWRGVAAGRRAMNAGAGYAAELAQITYDDAHAILATDSLHAGALNMLGKLNYEIMTLSWLERTVRQADHGQRSARRDELGAGGGVFDPSRRGRPGPGPLPLRPGPAVSASRPARGRAPAARDRALTAGDPADRRRHPRAGGEGPRRAGGQVARHRDRVGARSSSAGFTSLIVHPVRSRARERSTCSGKSTRAVWLCALVASSGCADAGVPMGATPGRPTFDGAAAYEHVLTQVGFGPRVPGTEGHAAQLAWMTERLSSVAPDFRADTFTHVTTTTGDTLELVNLHARFAPELTRRILLLAHWDTRPTSDEAPDSADWQTPVPGANDGASGTAVLLQLAELLGDTPPPVGVDLLLVDGEDYGPGLDDMLLGAKHYAANLPEEGRPVYGLLLDMVGDADPSFPVEAISAQYAQVVVRKVWQAAERLGYRDYFPTGVGRELNDDHVPLIEAGLPTANLIDFTYGTGGADNSFWHTPGRHSRAGQRRNARHRGRGRRGVGLLRGLTGGGARGRGHRHLSGAPRPRPVPDAVGRRVDRSGAPRRTG